MTRDEKQASIDFAAQLNRLCDKFRAQSGIHCRWDVAQHGHIDPFVAEVLYAAIEELLANVRRHARASRVEVETAMHKDGSMVLQVKDDGIGFTEPVSLQHWGAGLRLIDQRLRDVGAYLAIRNDSGACVTIVLPRWLVAG